jgi:hypothetical protein
VWIATLELLNEMKEPEHSGTVEGLIFHNQQQC